MHQLVSPHSSRAAVRAPALAMDRGKVVEKVTYSRLAGALLRGRVVGLEGNGCVVHGIMPQEKVCCLKALGAWCPPQVHALPRRCCYSPFVLGDSSEGMNSSQSRSDGAGRWSCRLGELPRYAQPDQLVRQ